jgi:hypothetical protein
VPQGPTYHGSWFRILLEGFEALGLRPGELCRAAGIEPEIGRDPDAEPATLGLGRGKER